MQCPRGICYFLLKETLWLEIAVELEKELETKTLKAEM
jgi:hypothetical protein